MCLTCVEDGTITRWLYDVIEAFDRRFDEAYGPGHIVIADCNVRDSDILWCLENSQDTGPWRGFLRWMLTVPLEERCSRHSYS